MPSARLCGDMCRAMQKSSLCALDLMAGVMPLNAVKKVRFIVNKNNPARLHSQAGGALFF